jgi:hypothetical protein
MIVVPGSALHPPVPCWFAGLALEPAEFGRGSVPNRAAAIGGTEGPPALEGMGPPLGLPAPGDALAIGADDRQEPGGTRPDRHLQQHVGTGLGADFAVRDRFVPLVDLLEAELHRVEHGMPIRRRQEGDVVDRTLGANVGLRLDAGDRFHRGHTTIGDADLGDAAGAADLDLGDTPRRAQADVGIRGRIGSERHGRHDSNNRKHGNELLHGLLLLSLESKLVGKTFNRQY